MAGLDREIDPLTGDYVSDGAGGTTKTRNALPAIYHQLKLPLGSWWGDPSAGIVLRRAKSGPRSGLVVDDDIRAALRALVEEGRISEPETEFERDGDRVIHATRALDLQTGEELDLTPLVPFDL